MLVRSFARTHQQPDRLLIFVTPVTPAERGRRTMVPGGKRQRVINNNGTEQRTTVARCRTDAATASKVELTAPHRSGNRQRLQNVLNAVE